MRSHTFYPAYPRLVRTGRVSCFIAHLACLVTILLWQAPAALSWMAYVSVLLLLAACLVWLVCWAWMLYRLRVGVWSVSASYERAVRLIVPLAALYTLLNAPAAWANMAYFGFVMGSFIIGEVFVDQRLRRVPDHL